MNWPFWIPILIASAALAVSFMTYLLTIKRDKEAREFAMWDRRHRMLLEIIKANAVVDNLAAEVPSLRYEANNISAQLKELKEIFRKKDLSDGSLQSRRYMEEQYTDVMVIAQNIISYHSDTVAVFKADRAKYSEDEAG
jgi:hypothetical protein